MHTWRPVSVSLMMSITHLLTWPTPSLPLWGLGGSIFHPPRVKFKCCKEINKTCQGVWKNHCKGAEPLSKLEIIGIICFESVIRKLL